MIDIKNPDFIQDVSMIWNTDFNNKKLPQNFIPNKEGLYAFISTDKNELLYLGRAIHLRNRIKQYQREPDYSRVMEKVLNHTSGNFKVFAWLTSDSKIEEIRCISRLKPFLNKNYKDWGLSEEVKKKILKSLKDASTNK